MSIIGTNMQTARYLVASLILAFVMFITPLIQNAHADNVNPGVFSPDSKPYGISYGGWTSKWWQWLISLPLSQNPANDDSGKNCANGQAGPVWFLAGAGSGGAERSCTIPVGKAILFPVIDWECSYAEDPQYHTESGLRTCATSYMDQVSHIEATVDGVSLQGLNKYRVQSPLFDLNLVKDNLFGVPAQSSQSVSDGYWVFLQPLSSGMHEVAFKALKLDVTATSPGSYAQDLKYHLIVK